MRRWWMAASPLLLASLAACGLLEIDPASKISAIEPISVRVEVIELGPLNPERASFPSTAAIAEFMPGDRVRFEVEVVDTDGLALADEELDTLWFQCADGLCQSVEVGLRDPVYEQPCEELEDWTMDSRCRLGRGRGSIEFIAPPLGEEYSWRIAAYVAIAWNGQRAERCWATRLSAEPIAPNCGFLTFDAFVGPTWSLLVHGDSVGVPSPVPIDALPAPLFLQQANRAPLIDSVEIVVDGLPQRLSPVDGTVGPVAVDPGDRVSMKLIPDPDHLLGQRYYFPLSGDYDVFSVTLESLWIRVSTAGPITFKEQFEQSITPVAYPFQLQVDEFAEPGIARAVLVVFDGRGAEDVVRVEFELQ